MHAHPGSRFRGRVGGGGEPIDDRRVAKGRLEIRGCSLDPDRLVVGQRRDDFAVQADRQRRPYAGFVAVCAVGSTRTAIPRTVPASLGLRLLSSSSPSAPPTSTQAFRSLRSSLIRFGLRLVEVSANALPAKYVSEMLRSVAVSAKRPDRYSRFPRRHCTLTQLNTARPKMNTPTSV
jgi:hypothetical protein